MENSCWTETNVIIEFQVALLLEARERERGNGNARRKISLNRFLICAVFVFQRNFEVLLDADCTSISQATAERAPVRIG